MGGPTSGVEVERGELSESIAKRSDIRMSNLLKVSILVAVGLAREQCFSNLLCKYESSEIMLLISFVYDVNHVFRLSWEIPLNRPNRRSGYRAQQRDQRTICLPAPSPSALYRCA